MTIEERAKLAAWQIFEEIGLSKHSVDRVSEIIEEKLHEQKAVDLLIVRKGGSNETIPDCKWRRP